MPNMWMDDEGKKILDEIRKEISEEGIKNPTYGDAVRRLKKNASR